MAFLPRTARLTRILAVLLVVVGVPAAVTASTLVQEEPIREGEPAPRTVVAPEPIRVEDPDATRRARNQAAEAMDPVLEPDEEARQQIVEGVLDDFGDIDDVRASLEAASGDAGDAADEEDGADEGDDEPGDDALDEHVDELQRRLPALAEDGARLALELSDDEVERAASQSADVAATIAELQIAEDRVDEIRQTRLRAELADRDVPGEVSDELVEPIVAQALQPTVREDPEQTEAAREDARQQVAPVRRTFTQGSEIVTVNEEVAAVQMAALHEAGLAGAEPGRFFVQAMLLTVALVLVAGLYLRAYRRRVWASPRRLLLLSVLLLAYAIGLEAVTLLAPPGQTAWLFVLPAGAVAMLATILLDPPIGVLSTIPMATLAALAVPTEPSLVVFTALVSLGSVPLVSRLSARGDLRKAAVRSTVGYALLAALAVAAFDQPELAPLAAGAGLLNGVVTAVVVNGSLPFLESAFGMLTATSLLDLADRNHPMLRELEHKALGSYNHSVMVAQMTERACRAVGADGLLGSVAALYHDIGKTQRPYFFVENQFGMTNPHDELEPDESARIIREHVPHGIELGRRHRLPPEIVEGIACHHGTTRVSYFYSKAREQATDPDEVDEADFRYPGPKPGSKEMAILMLADCCESAARAAALNDRNLSRDDLVGIVYTLTGDRVEDGQLDESALTFWELAVAQESFIETLVGVYHPRIAYPDSDRTREPASRATEPAVAPDAEPR